MNGDTAKKIFVNFLKEKKIMGKALPYFFGKPSYNTLQMCGGKYLSNTKILNEEAKKTDEKDDEDFIARHLIDMLGRTRTPAVMFMQPKRDYLFEIYLEWEFYIQTHKHLIYKNYFQTKNE